MKAFLPFIYSLDCLTTKNAKGNKSSPQETIVKICFATTIFYEKQKNKVRKIACSFDLRSQRDL